MRVLTYWMLIIGFVQLMGQGKMVFDKTVHDFGQLREVDGSAEISFRFVNEGDTSIQVTNVIAACGCTTPYWSKEPILAGDTGEIIVRYSTVNRPGPFSKTVQVASNGEPQNQILIISGRVQPKPNPIEDEFPTKLGMIRMKYQSLNMGKITTEKSVTKSFDVYNDSDSLVRFDSKMMMPEYLQVNFDPVELQAKERGQILLTYDPNLKNALGYQSDKLILTKTDSISSGIDVLVLATIEEFFPKMTDEVLERSPKLTVTDDIMNLGSIMEGDTLKTDITLKNEGKQKLLIRNTQSNCDCLIAHMDESEIDPGQEIKVHLEFNTKGRKGKQYKSVTIFSNDPRAPARTITIRADVKEN